MLSSVNTTASPPPSPPRQAADGIKTATMSWGAHSATAATTSGPLQKEYCALVEGDGAESDEQQREGRQTTSQPGRQKTSGSCSGSSSVVVRTDCEDDDERVVHDDDDVIEDEGATTFDDDAESGRGQDDDADCDLHQDITGIDTSMEVDPSIDNADCNPDNSVNDTLFVSGLHRDVRSGDLQDKFSKLGVVEECRIVINPVSKESRGFAFLRYKDSTIAEKAVKELNKIQIMGKIMTVERAKRSEPHRKTPGQYKGPLGASVKYDKEGRLRPGFVPFWDLPPPKDGSAIFDTSDIKVEQDTTTHPPPRRRSSDYSPHRQQYYYTSSNCHNRRASSRHHHMTAAHHSTRHPQPYADGAHDRDQHSRSGRHHQSDFAGQDDDHHDMHRYHYHRRYTHGRSYRDGSPAARPSSALARHDVYSSGSRYDNINGQHSVRSPGRRVPSWEVRRGRPRGVYNSEETRAYTFRDTVAAADADCYNTVATNSSSSRTRGERASPHCSGRRVYSPNNHSRYTHPYQRNDDPKCRHAQRDVQSNYCRRPSYTYGKSGGAAMSDDEFMPIYSHNHNHTGRAEYSGHSSPTRQGRSRSAHRATDGTYRAVPKMNQRSVDYRLSVATTNSPPLQRCGGNGGTTFHYSEYRENSNALKTATAASKSSLSPEMRRGAPAHKQSSRYDAEAHSNSSSDGAERTDAATDSRDCGSSRDGRQRTTQRQQHKSEHYHHNSSCSSIH
eukprot:Lankesteria_metandrocarpae@DN4703_c0_g1_i1.p1